MRSLKQRFEHREATAECARVPAGLGVLQHLRMTLVERFNSLTNLPHLRLLHIDTDPETNQEATQGEGPEILTPNESLLARLHRPSHYLRPREGRVGFESWLDPKMLYRIPRNLTTTGLRSLGRLAFFDNYRAFIRRYAELAQATGAYSFAVGAELSQLTGPDYRDQWLRVVDDARRHYRGPLVYAANWGEDH